MPHSNSDSSQESRQQLNSAEEEVAPPAYESAVTPVIRQPSQQHLVLRPRPDAQTNVYLKFVGFSPLRWSALLQIYTSDVLYLMTNGLFVTTDNVRESKSYFLQSDAINESNRQRGYTQGRKYYLESNGLFGSRWHGSLKVFAGDFRTLSSFRIGYLSVDLIRSASAWNKDGNQIYAYESVYPDQAWNAVYDDRPVKGLWPWPRNTLETEEKAASQGCCVVQ
ncbi:hypothetical protein CDD80_638 [Ophiocordyceps camponoti-rufipedis]|uniref:Uncharacterized protein n=1 Tax=Ophiocordyceps camponoti-rufipedis TaxID=2004952 RepID=A0A2C5ZFB5_9HYPO|nr:hypothetical protein CDD80_638 [Ophiocordyceps camponoti-rufipedis]